MSDVAQAIPLQGLYRQPLETEPQTIAVAERPFIKDSIQLSLEASMQGNASLVSIAPTQEEIQHVSVIFKNRKLDNIDVITYDLISGIGRNEFQKLNDQLKTFTSKMSSIKSPGLFTLIDDLSKNVNQADLDTIWERTVNAKPTVKARIISWFRPSAINENLQDQYRNVYKLLTERSKGLEVKLSEIERKLVQQKHDQENNIRALHTSFETYYNSFQEVRDQFIFVLYLEEFYKTELEKFKATNSSSIQTTRKINEYESTLRDIENKRLVLQGALIKFPITVQQNQNLIEVCKNILKEIDNTLLGNFTSIRSNLLGLGVALNAQQAMLGTNTAKTLDDNLSKMSMKINSDLSVKAELFAGQSRLREAEQIRSMVLEIRNVNEEIQRAKEQSKQDIQQATDILNESAQELRTILGK